MSMLASVLLATAGSITLMACYGVSPDYQPCVDDDGTCYEYCYSDAECLQGDYCNEDYQSCEFGGTCTADAQCADGYECDESRSTCIPDETVCVSDTECAWGTERCDVTTGDCVPAQTCGLPDVPGCAEGTVCNFDNAVCVPCEGDACGACTGELTCAAPAPLCPEGMFPTLRDGCYTGGCVAAATCDAQACAALDEEACIVSDACEAVYQGVNCTDPEGDPCSGEGTCTCETFVYDRCVSASE